MPPGDVYLDARSSARGPLSRSGRDAEDIRLVPAGLMWKASPLFPPARGVSPSPRVAAGLLLRKEVIQPLVPQRLPCYDFIPITTHTLDGSPPCG